MVQGIFQMIVNMDVLWGKGRHTHCQGGTETVIRVNGLAKLPAPKKIPRPTP